MSRSDYRAAAKARRVAFLWTMLLLIALSLVFGKLPEQKSVPVPCKDLGGNK